MSWYTTNEVGDLKEFTMTDEWTEIIKW
jgi:hypothetical protein